MLQISEVGKRFGSTVALTDVSFRVSAGEVCAVVGENGSGKSTLMRILAGEERPDSGQLFLDGKPYQPRQPLDARDAGVGLIHQELALCGHMTVFENIFLGQESTVVRPRERAAQAHQLLTSLGFPEIDAEARVSELPISQRQIVEIARAAGSDARVILFDEPTSSLTESDIAKLFALIRRLREQGKAIIYISHFLDEVREVADRVVVLRDGQKVAESEIDSITNEQIVAHMVGRDIADLYPRSPRSAGELLLEVKQLSGVQSKPRDVHLTLRRGEVVGIAGLNGSGRTELLRTIFGLRRATTGVVTHDGKRVQLHPESAWGGGMGLVSEDRKTEGLALSMSIAENLTLPRKDGFRHSPSQTATRAEGWSQRMRVKCRDVNQRIGELSGGNQQKVAIARLLDAECDVLLLDEPTRGIDVGSKAEIYQLIDDLANQGKAILLVSSYLPELLGTCDRIAVMNRGQLSEPIDVSKLDQEKLMEMCVQ